MGLAVAVGVFALSLMFRTIDPALCALTGGIGTHFMWYLLNAAMVGAVLVVLIWHIPAPVSRRDQTALSAGT